MKDYCPNDCSLCQKAKEICFYNKKNLSWQCPICKEFIHPTDIYEYRGSECCVNCTVINRERRIIERNEAIGVNRNKTDRFSGLDLSDSQIGKANKEILKVDIELAKKE